MAIEIDNKCFKICYSGRVKKNKNGVEIILGVDYKNNVVKVGI